MNDDDKCECGHLRDEHDASGECTVEVGDDADGEPDRCACLCFAKDWDEAVKS